MLIARVYLEACIDGRGGFIQQFKAQKAFGLEEPILGRYVSTVCNLSKLDQGGHEVALPEEALGQASPLVGIGN
ncbi:hypothetical protein MASR2M48_20870 [Spirochaetota bacterium]